MPGGPDSPPGTIPTSLEVDMSGEDGGSILDNLGFGASKCRKLTVVDKKARGSRRTARVLTIGFARSSV
jgi:hypothetical protein